MQFRFHHLVLSVGTIFAVVGVGLLLITAMQDLPVSEGEPEESVPISESSSSMTFHSNRLLIDDALSLAKLDDASEYDRVEARGGEFVSLDDGNTYGVWWEPEGFDAEHDVVLVSLGGHGGWATKDFDVWYPEISDRGYAFFSLQWWLGRSLENNGYYEPEEMYAMIRQVLIEKGVTPGNVVFNTYSMSSARSYAITALDRVSEDFFALTISNSGVWEDSYPPNENIVNGTYGPLPFEGHPWISGRGGRPRKFHGE
jgi:hypothetical protein